MKIRLIIMCPSLRQIRQFRFGRSAFLGLAVACVASLCVAIAIARTFPSRINDAEYGKLQAENRTLALQRQSVAFEVQRLQARLLRMEKTSDRIAHEIQSQGD